MGRGGTLNMKKWIILLELPRYNVWFNIKGGFRTCFWKDEDPNELEKDDEDDQQIN